MAEFSRLPQRVGFFLRQLQGHVRRFNPTGGVSLYPQR